MQYRILLVQASQMRCLLQVNRVSNVDKASNYCGHMSIQIVGLVKSQSSMFFLRVLHTIPRQKF